MVNRPVCKQTHPELLTNQPGPAVFFHPGIGACLGYCSLVSTSHRTLTLISLETGRPTGSASSNDPNAYVRTFIWKMKKQGILKQQDNGSYAVV